MYESLNFSMESCVFWILVWIGGPWYEFLGFLPRVWL